MGAVFLADVKQGLDVAVLLWKDRKKKSNPALLSREFAKHSKVKLIPEVRK